MNLPELIALRRRWLDAARVYYLQPGDDSGMDDYTWDHFARTLHARRTELPWCPILNDPRYEGGSLFWVNESLYDSALAAEPRG